MRILVIGLLLACFPGAIVVAPAAACGSIPAPLASRRK